MVWDARELKRKLDRPVALVGMMGAGKTTVGRRLARKLDLPFLDADAEIEKAAGRSVTEIFEEWGEEAFRTGERRVTSRLIQTSPSVIATGGGAFGDAAIREMLLESTITVWLNADVETLHARTLSRREHRPLLHKGDARALLDKLALERESTYKMAHIEIKSGATSRQQVAEIIANALADFVKTGFAP